MAQLHDLFFKQTFSYPEHAVDFLKSALPAELTAEIDYSSIVSEKDSYVDRIYLHIFQIQFIPAV